MKVTGKIILIELLHIIPILLIGAYTVPKLDHVTISSYLVFIASFTLPILFSIFLQVKYGKGTFFYLFSLLLFLGFPFKFSMHEISNVIYYEPIGMFDYSSEAFLEVVKLAIYGVSGLFMAQLIAYFFFIKKNRLNENLELKSINLNQFKAQAIILGATLAMGLLNLKYNILLLGMTPDIILPLKGNTIYFLVLTRFIPIALFFYGLIRFSYIGMSLGALIFLFSSVGVISRMVMLTYFIVITIYMIQSFKNISVTSFVKKISFIVILFGVTSYATVSLSTRLRYILNREMVPKSKISSIQKNGKNGLRSNLKETMSLGAAPKTMTAFMSLAVDRWIGMEGAMALVSHPKKSFSLLLDALKEPGFKNDGRSFYNKIADLKLMKIMRNLKEFKNISTSVPGPFAFFYYPGNRLFLIFSIFCFSMLIFSIESCMETIFLNNRLVTIYISVFMTFDFYQFGISPIAFIKYWSFSFFCIITWLIIDKNLFTKRFDVHTHTCRKVM